jgi:AcrR family transcriptional regulator
VSRDNQKRRTRRALVQAAGQLVAAGRLPSVAEVADAAEVSRRTAYRYFPTAEQLKVEAILEALRPGMERAIESGEPAGGIEERVDRLVTALHRLTLDNEPLLRQMIRFAVERGPIEPGVPPRPSRRLEYIEKTLSPLRGHLDEDRFDRLVNALAVVIGIEATLVLRDICGLDSDEIVDIERWAAQALLRAAMVPAERRERARPAR